MNIFQADFNFLTVTKPRNVNLVFWSVNHIFHVWSDVADNPAFSP